jgi:hypothetical protein
MMRQFKGQSTFGQPSIWPQIRDSVWPDIRPRLRVHPPLNARSSNCHVPGGPTIISGRARDALSAVARSIIEILSNGQRESLESLTLENSQNRKRANRTNVLLTSADRTRIANQESSTPKIRIGLCFSSYLVTPQNRPIPILCSP